jgi:outer membrane protein assembly factor BamB
MSIAFLTLSLLSVSTQTAQQDWPQFMGPEATSRVALKDANFEWGPAGPKVEWKLDVGMGYGGVAIHDGMVILMDREPGELDILRVMDLQTGEELWDDAYEAPGRLSFPGSRSVPTVTRDFILTMGGHGHLSCYSRKSKSLAWQVDVAEDYGGRLPDFGWSNSPLLVGNLVIISALGDEVGLVAFNVESGEEAWVTPGLGSSHSTPVLLNLLGKEQVIFLSNQEASSSRNGTGKLTISSFDPKTGEQIWQEDVLGTTYPIPPAIRIDAERFFVTGGYGGGSSMIKLKKSGTKYEVEQLYHIPGGSQTHAAILHDNNLYLTLNENSNYPRRSRNTGGLMCMSLDGKEQWRTGEDPFFGRGNWIVAGEHLLIQDGFNGNLTICKASADDYEPVAEANLFGKTGRKDHEMWAPMAISNGLLLLRSKEELICVNLLQPAD